ncbi:MAG TPA: DUF192 domain-containing protein [Mycobacteriales bacterium]|nr:DUF192 domain-containing protein [Mycobacteriales bacterium]
MRSRAGLTLLLAVSVVALGACSGGDPAPAASGPPPPVGSRSTAPSPTASLVLPPVPAGGFDPPVQVRVEGAPPLTAEVARRPDQRARGLMQRTSLAPDAGMVFLFPERGSGGFHMLGTLIPLSIAYVDGDRVVSTAEMTPCPGQDCPTYPPAGPYTFAVEAVAGFFPEHGVGPGSRITVVGTTAPPQ